MVTSLESTLYGPFTPEVRTFLESLNSIRWFTNLGAPVPDDSAVVRVGFEEIAWQATPYELWGDTLAAQERALDRRIVDATLLSEQLRLQGKVEITGSSVDDFFVGLTDRYPGYYGESALYAHEVIELPVRLIRNAAYEVMLDGGAGAVGFFGSLMPWFHRGHWPAGMRDGKLLLCERQGMSPRCPSPPNRRSCVSRQCHASTSRVPLVPDRVT